MSLANLKLLKAGKRRFTLLGRLRVIGLHYGPIDSISFNIWRLDGSVSNSTCFVSGILAKFIQVY